MFQSIGKSDIIVKKDDDKEDISKPNRAPNQNNPKFMETLNNNEQNVNKILDTVNFNEGKDYLQAPKGNKNFQTNMNHTL